MREIAEQRDRRAGRSGEPFALRPRTQAITLEIIMRTVFGIEDAERLARLRERLGRDARHRHAASRALAAIALPPLRTHDRARASGQRFLRLRAEADAVIYDEIAPPPRGPDIARARRRAVDPAPGARRGGPRR